MPSNDRFVERQIKSARDRRAARVKLLSGQIKNSIDYNLQDVEAGRGASDDITGKVSELTRLYAELDAIRETIEIYECDDLV